MQTDIESDMEDKASRAIPKKKHFEDTSDENTNDDIDELESNSWKKSKKDGADSNTKMLKLQPSAPYL